MKPDLLFDFIPNKKDNTLKIVREFAADRQLVWDCYTKSEYLDLWFAPKPLIAKTKSMDFKNGGHWHYAMITPEGEEYWGYTEFYDIHAIDYYNTIDSFCDSNANINAELPKAKWHVEFVEKEENTIVEINVQYESLTDLETVLNMGMEEGMKSTLERLDELILKLSKEEK
ncbi:MAG: SRPBCC domain-containing protein [Leptospiraceae bacterium]|nr:SRPBCC domain-containing protein [Leptospiraceae bacterium]